MGDPGQGVDEGRRGWGGAQVASEGAQTIVSLWGEHDVCCTAATVVAALSRAVDAGGDVVVDLGEVSFLDASTLGLIACTEDLLRRQARSLSVRSPSRFASRLLGVCGMAWLIEAPSWVGGPLSASAAESSPSLQASETRSLDEREHGP